MEISRLLFSKETKEKIEKGISPKRKGELRWEKLKEAEENGLLQQAKTRADVGRLAGITSDKTAYGWVSAMVNKKAIIETVTGFENMRAVYEYRLGSPVKRKKKAKEEAMEKIQNEMKRQGLTRNDLTVRERGKIMFARLKEIEASGELTKANCRADVATLVGYDESEAKAGYSWVSNLVIRGHLTEKMIGVSPSGKVMYEYSLTGTEPLYRYEEARNRKEKKVENQKVWVEQNKPVVQNNSIKITISKGDINFELELSDIEQTGELIKTILKGD